MYNKTMAKLDPVFADIIKANAQSPVDIAVLALALQVQEPTIRKVLSDSELALVTREKIIGHLKSSSRSEKIKADGRVTLWKIQRCYELYCKYGTMQRVADEIKITKERVRQLLARGEALKLFELPRREKPPISKSRLRRDYRKYLSKKKVAEAHNISIRYLNELFAKYKITRKSLSQIRIAKNKKETIQQYCEYCIKRGEEMDSANLHSTIEGLKILNKIMKTWNGIQAFRKDLEDHEDD